MRQFAHQQSQMGFAFLALGDVDRRTCETDDVAGFVAQRLDMQIVPARTVIAFERDFRAFRLAARQGLAFQRDRWSAGVRGKISSSVRPRISSIERPNMGLLSEV